VRQKLVLPDSDLLVRSLHRVQVGLHVRTRLVQHHLVLGANVAHFGHHALSYEEDLSDCPHHVRGTVC
jgi:hypothetical protein